MRQTNLTRPLETPRNTAKVTRPTSEQTAARSALYNNPKGPPTTLQMKWFPGLLFYPSREYDSGEDQHVSRTGSLKRDGVVRKDSIFDVEESEA